MERLHELFEAALDQPKERRAAFLAGLSAADAELRSELKALLDAHNSDDDFLDRPLTAVEDLLVELNSDWKTGDRIGPYRVTGELGRGGMGRVLLGQRDDGAFEQTVAIKLLRPALASAQFVGRFQTEREVLARLEHFYIAHIIDGGSTETGLPYLVMERVDGVRLDVWARAEGGQLDDRLSLFAKVCQAVQYAHQRLIVHGDLKPANILVTTGPGGQALPKLLDFGVAQVLSGEGAASAEAAGAATPGYASPEQLRSAPLTTSCDVYSLGVILYELLANAPPFGLERRPNERAPERPSSLPSALHIPEWTLREDLDEIALKATSFLPDSRYSTVQELLGDLDLARRGAALSTISRSRTHLARRSLRQNRQQVLALLIILGAVVSVMLALKLQRDVAIDKEQESRRTTEFLARILTSVDPSNEGRNVDFRAVVDLAAETVSVEFRDEPAILAELEAALGRTYHHLGMHGRARPFLERSLALRRSLARVPREDVAESLEHLGELLYDMDELGAAESALVEALKLRKRLGASTGLGLALNDMGLLRYGQGRFSEAKELLLEGIEHRRVSFGEASEEVLLSWNNLALVLAELGDEQGEERALDRAVQSARTMKPPRPRALILALFNQATMHRFRADLERSQTVFVECTSLAQEKLGDDHLLTAQARGGLGLTLAELGQWPEAERLMRSALEVQLQHLEPKSTLVSQGHFRIGTLYAYLAHWGQAQEHLGAAYEGYRVFGEEHPWALTVALRLARVELKLGLPEQSERRAQHVLSLRGGDSPSGDVLIAEAWFVLGLHSASQSDFVAAKSHFARALANEPPDTLRFQTLEALAEVHLNQGDSSAAESLIRGVLQNYAASIPDQHPRVGRALGILGRALANGGQTEAAREVLQRSQRQLAHSLAASHPWLLEVEAALQLLP